MSSIGPTSPGLDPSGFAPVGGQVSLDEARRQDLLRGDQAPGLADAAPADLVDAGETVLSLSAWDGDGPRMLPRADGLASQLGGMDRAEAANAGVDGILAAL